MSVIGHRLRTLAQVAAGGFTPSDIAGLQLWLDANDAATFTFGSGTRVSQWNDKSVNTRNFTQATGGNQPDRSGTQNGKTSVIFTAASSYFMTAGDTLDLLTADLTIAASVKFGAATSQGVLTKSLFNSGAGRWGLYKDTDLTGVYSNSGSTLRTVVEAAYTATTWETVVLLVNRSGGAITLRRDATQKATTSFTAESVSVNSAFHLLLGAYGDSTGTGGTQAGYFLNGEIGEVVVYNSAISGTDLSNVETYLSTKWGT